MKSLVTLFLSVLISHTVWAFDIDQATCNKFASDLSTGAFNPDTNGPLYEPVGLNKGIGVRYIQNVRHALSDQLKIFCNADTHVSFEAFRSKFTSLCNGQCQINKGMFAADKRDAVDLVCSNICDTSEKKLDFARVGYESNKCATDVKASGAALSEHAH